MLEQSNFTSIMANYRNLEIDFIERTLELIAQYEAMMHKYEFENQFNHTLLVNCLLGLIVLPKERTVSFLPQERIDETMRENIGIKDSFLNEEIVHLKSLVIALRHSIAHFDIAFESEDENYLIDRIVFKDQKKGDNYIVASFVPTELLSFLRYYSYWLISVIRNYRE